MSNLQFGLDLLLSSRALEGPHWSALNLDVKVNTKEIEDARWFSRAEVMQMLQQQHPQGLFVARQMGETRVKDAFSTFFPNA